MGMDPPHGLDDDQLLSDVFSTDEDATFQNQLEAVRPRGIRSALRILRDAETSEDLVDDVIVRLFAHRRRPPEGRDFEEWFLRCVKNAAISMTRSPAWNRSTDGALAELPSSDNPLEHALQNEQHDSVMKALAKLSLGDRQLIRLWFVEEVKLKRIASHMQLSESTVYSRIMGAKKLLIKYLKGGRR